MAVGKRQVNKNWFFMLILNFDFFNLVHRDIVDISAPKLSLAPPLLPNCGRPRMILRLPFLILCWVTFCKQGNPCLSTIPESSSISNAKRTKAGAPWVKDTRASMFNVVEPFFYVTILQFPFPLMHKSTRQSWSVDNFRVLFHLQGSEE